MAASIGHLGGLGELFRLPNHPGLLAGWRVCWVFNPPNQYSPAENRRLAPSWRSNGPTNSLFPQRRQVVVEVAAAAAGDLVEWHAAVLRVRANTPPQGPGRLGSAGSRCRLGLIGAVGQAAPGRLVVEIGMVDLVKPGELGGYFQAQRSDGG